MCYKYGVCGKNHKRKDKYRRNLKGQFDRDRRLATVFVIVVGIVSMSLIGVNTIIGGLRSLERTIMVDNVQAEEVVTNLTWQEEVRSLLNDYGIDLVKAEKIIYCESRWNPQAVNHNKGSVDYGLWQINNVYHPEVTKDCALDAGCSTMEAIRIIKTKGFQEWSCNKLIK